MSAAITVIVDNILLRVHSPPRLDKEVKMISEKDLKVVRFNLDEFNEFDENELVDEVNKEESRRGGGLGGSGSGGFDDEEVEADKDNILFYDNVAAVKRLRAQIQSEDMFFDPLEDEEDDKWVKKTLSKISPPLTFISPLFDRSRRRR